MRFEIPSWAIEDFEDEFVFDDGEDDDDIRERIDEAFEEWLDEIKDSIMSYAEKDVEEL